MQAPESLATQLVSGAAGLGCELSPETTETLLAYMTMLGRWNRVYNLTAIRDARDVLAQHVLDSLSLVMPLRRTVKESGARLLDVGSGGGLPGLVVAAVLPDLRVTCVDSVGKKAGFIRQAAVELGLRNVRALHCRVEDLHADRFDVVTSRAFAALADFVELTAPTLGSDGVWVAMKGKEPRDEIATLPPGIEMFHVEHLQIPGLASERCLVWMRKRAIQ